MNILREKRLQACLQLKEAAARVGCDPGNLSRIEQGKQLPSVALARRMAKVYGLTFNEIFDTPPAGGPENIDRTTV